MWRFSKSKGITEGFHNKMEMMTHRTYGHSSASFYVDNAFWNATTGPTSCCVNTSYSTSGSWTSSADSSVSPVPEPVSTLLLGIGLVGIGYSARRGRKMSIHNNELPATSAPGVGGNNSLGVGTRSRIVR